MSEEKKFKMYRKPQCPFGKKAENLLKDKGYENFQDHKFKDKEEEESFKEQHSVKTTPQIFVNEERVGGYDELAAYFGEEPEKDDDSEKQSYTPIIALFSVSVLLSLATGFSMFSWMGFFLVLLATQKLMDIKSFKEGFENYDLLTPAVPFYGFLYPFLELFAGLSFLSQSLLTFGAFVSIVNGAVGGVSIFKAVYIDKRDLNCACVGGGSRVPLGAVSFSENAVMFVMGVVTFSFYI